MIQPRRLAALVLLTGALALASPPVAGSDHADPALHPPPTQDPGLTGLFAFPRNDSLVLILNAHRGLTTPPPYEVEGYEYAIHLDLHSQVAYDKAADRARYGGTVVDPAGIDADATIRFRLRSDGSLQPGYPKYEGLLSGSESFPAFAGVRDDPFIFPRFFRKNVISMVVSVPMAAFPRGQQDWLIWGTTTKIRNGRQIDHVGRSNRTQLGRLDFLNTLPPKDHVAAVQKRLEGGQWISRTFMHLITHFPFLQAPSGLFEYVLQIRHYDVFPDVMIFTTRFPPGFPNGRKLEDDVAALTCAVGDCVLQEVSFIEGHFPRVTTNDRPFLDEFPYLAAPWPTAPEVRAVDRHVLYFWLVLAGLLVLLILWSRRRLRRVEVPVVRPYVPPVR